MDKNQVEYWKDRAQVAEGLVGDFRRLVEFQGDIICDLELALEARRLELLAYREQTTGR